MATKHDSNQKPDATADAASAAPALPPGTPAWLTAELVALTLKTWGPHYPEGLTPEDAVAMILAVGRLFGRH